MRKLVLIFLGILVLCSGFSLAGFILFISQNQIVAHQFPMEQKWLFKADALIGTTPVIYKDYVLVRTDESLQTLNASTGHLVWSVSFPGDKHPDPPLVHDEIVIVTHLSGTTALKLATGEHLWEIQDPDTRVDARPAAATENVVVVIDTYILIRDIETGELLWKIQNPYVRSDSLVFLNNKGLYVVFEDEIRSYNIQTGELLWRTSTEEWSLRNGHFDDDILYLERREEGLSAYSLEERRTLWQRDDVFLDKYPMSKYRDTLFIGSRGAAPVALSASTGQTLWEAEGVWNYDNYQTPLIFDNLVYIRGLFQKKIYVLNLDDGKVLGRINLGIPDIVSINAAYSLGPVRYKDSIIFPAGDKLLAYEK